MREEFAAAAVSYDEAAVLAREVGERLLRKLEWVRLAPARLLDVGCATGDGVLALAKRYPQALPIAVDYAWPMLLAARKKSGWFARLAGRAPRLLHADVRALPFAQASLDLVWSNLMLHWLSPEDLGRAFREVRRVLAPGGLFLFAQLGPDTLKGLRETLVAIGAQDSLARFPDMHDVGDLLLACGFAEPVMEMESITLAYASPRRFLADLRHLGVRDGLLGRQAWPRWRMALRRWQGDRSDLLVEFEIVYGLAWCPAQASTQGSRAEKPLRFMPYSPSRR